MGYVAPESDAPRDEELEANKPAGAGLIVSDATGS